MPRRRSSRWRTSASWATCTPCCPRRRTRFTSARAEFVAAPMARARRKSGERPCSRSASRRERWPPWVSSSPSASVRPGEPTPSSRSTVRTPATAGASTTCSLCSSASHSTAGTSSTSEPPRSPCSTRGDRARPDPPRTLGVDMSGGHVYLDHAATTPVRPDVVDVVAARLRMLGNPSSLHASGRAARKSVEESRETVAAVLGARPGEVVFTPGGTEADNLAVKGLFWARRAADPRRTRILASAVEHHAVLDAVQWLAEAEGATVEWLPVDRLGRVDPATLDAALNRDPQTVALVTVMWASNEVGTVQPVARVVEAARAHGVPVHSDAVQAVGQLPVDFAATGLDAMTVSGHKVGGPMGVGALVVCREVELVPVLHGGGQEREVRSGTLDVAAIAGFAAAVDAATAARAEEAPRLAALRDALVASVLAAAPDAVLNGDAGADGRLPGNAHLSFPGCEGDSLMLLLDARGIECSTGSACSAGVPEPFHVLLAMGVDPLLARGSLRFSLGHTSTEADVEAVAEAVGPVVERARTAGLVNIARVS